MSKVLVVDDDQDLLEMVSLILTSHGFSVSTLNAGQEFFERIRTVIPDIILMDIYLGDADGRDLCRQCKTSDTSAKTPILLYSAGNIPTSTIEMSKADDFFQKPFDIRQLVRKIHHFLGTGRVEGS